MYDLTSTLSTASEALNADSGAIAVTNNNISNVNTAGYSRQIVNLSAEALNSSGHLQDAGVSFGGFTSVRDQILQISINRKTSELGSFTAQSTSWSQIDSSFSGTTTGLGAAMSTFFSSVSGLSTAPNDPASRQAAYSAASQLVNQFHQAAAALSDTQSNADQTVAGTVSQINQLSAQIATLDQQLAQTQGSNQDGGSLQDQRDALTTQLAQITGLTSITTTSTPTLALPNGTPLVIGGTAYALQLSRGVDGKTHVLTNQGQDLTANLTGGTLGGALTMRDQQIPSISTSLDQLAAQFSSAINTAQSQGFDSTGTAGQPMFSVPATGTSTAAGITLAISGPAGIAASSNGSAGNGGNVAKLMAVESQPLPSGQTPSGTYASLVQNIGTASAEATASQNASNTSLSQLTTLRSSASGVSIDEETTKLLRYQQAYSAAAQVISTVNNLFSVVLNMSR